MFFSLCMLLGYLCLCSVCIVVVVSCLGGVLSLCVVVVRKVLVSWVMLLWCLCSVGRCRCIMFR